MTCCFGWWWGGKVERPQFELQFWHWLVLSLPGSTLTVHASLSLSVMTCELLMGRDSILFFLVSVLFWKVCGAHNKHLWIRGLDYTKYKNCGSSDDLRFSYGNLGTEHVIRTSDLQISERLHSKEQLRVIQRGPITPGINRWRLEGADFHDSNLKSHSLTKYLLSTYHMLVTVIST